VEKRTYPVNIPKMYKDYVIDVILISAQSGVLSITYLPKTTEKLTPQVI